MSQTLVRDAGGTLVDLEDSKGLPVLGYTLVWYFRQSKVKHGILCGILEDVGLAKYVPAKPPTDRATLKRAVWRWAESRGVQKAEAAVMADRIQIRTINSADAEFLAYVVVFETRDRRELGIDLDVELRVLMQKKTGNIAVTLEKRGKRDDVVVDDSLTAGVMAAWDEVRDVWESRDLYTLTREIVRGEQGVMIHPDGGMYFVLGTKAGAVASVRAMIEKINSVTTGATLRVFPHLDVPLARDQLAASAEDALFDEVEKLAEGLDGLEKRQDKGKIRANTVARKLARGEAMRQKISSYADMLGVRQGRFEADLDAFESRAGAVPTVATGVRKTRRSAREAVVDGEDDWTAGAVEVERKGRRNADELAAILPGLPDEDGDAGVDAGRSGRGKLG